MALTHFALVWSAVCDCLIIVTYYILLNVLVIYSLVLDGKLNTYFQHLNDENTYSFPPYRNVENNPRAGLEKHGKPAFFFSFDHFFTIMAFFDIILYVLLLNVCIYVFKIFEVFPTFEPITAFFYNYRSVTCSLNTYGVNRVLHLINYYSLSWCLNEILRLCIGFMLKLQSKITGRS